ncbi:TPA: hypothetical protein DEP58_05040 [Patescibacteria group bacterium]|nr:MAG: hypothetical protein UU98_C0008G0026 [Parcubacteria group bacterium GW2011_GWD2_42_14]HCC05631.1 hypothetical protein [Patescibacteria group bacterium]
MGKRLESEIREHLIEVLGLTKGSLAARISEIKLEHPQLTPAAAAQMFARRKNKSIMRFLNDEDKRTLATVINTVTSSTVTSRVYSVQNKKVKSEPILNFHSEDCFVKRHIQEINDTYHAACYTATFILCRKVMENLIVQILKNKFPENKSLFEDTKSRRNLDFSVVLDNLYKKRTEFSISGGKVIERIKQKTTPFKSDANNKAHSLFHIASRKEIEEANIQEIFDLIIVVMKEVGL